MMLSVAVLLSFAAEFAHAADPAEFASASDVGVYDDGNRIIDLRQYLDAPVLPEVVGGHPAKVDQWPDTALVWMNGSLCTGVLIHPQWMLTAGHCTYGDGAEPVSVVVGLTSFAELRGTPREGLASRDVVKSIPHPAYKRQQWGHDIALIKLAEPVTDIAPRVIASDCVIDESLQNGDMVSVVGWGSTTVDGNGGGYVLNTGKTEIETFDCSKNQVDGIVTGCDPSARPAGELGAGGNGVDACFGDSGGPLYLETETGTWLVGITSRAYMGVPYDEPCGHGGIYTRPDSVLQWIEDTIGEALPRPVCTLPPEVTADPVRTHLTRPAKVVLHVTDADGETWTTAVKAQGAHGTVTIEDGEVIYRAEDGFIGQDSIVLTVTDDGSAAYPETPGASVDVTVPVEVTEAMVAGQCGCNTGSPLSGASMLGLAALLVRRRR
jgi:hypothetical protein